MPYWVFWEIKIDPPPMGRKLQDMLAYYGPCPHHLFLYKDPALSHPPLWLALDNFEPNISRIYTPQLQSCLSLLHDTPMKMERIVSSKKSALQAQTLGDYPKDAIRQLNCCCLLHSALLNTQHTASLQQHKDRHRISVVATYVTSRHISVFFFPEMVQQQLTARRTPLPFTSAIWCCFDKLMYHVCFRKPRLLIWQAVTCLEVLTVAV